LVYLQYTVNENSYDDRPVYIALVFLRTCWWHCNGEWRWL